MLNIIVIDQIKIAASRLDALNEQTSNQTTEVLLFIRTQNSFVVSTSSLVASSSSSSSPLTTKTDRPTTLFFAIRYKAIFGLSENDYFFTSLHEGPAQTYIPGTKGFVITMYRACPLLRTTWERPKIHYKRDSFYLGSVRTFSGLKMVISRHDSAYPGSI